MIELSNLKLLAQGGQAVKECRKAQADGIEHSSWWKLI